MSKRLTTEQFIERAKATHGDKYDYSKVEYVNSQTKVKIDCPIHDEFEQTPKGHMRGNGCPTCGCIATAKVRRSSSGKFIEKARSVHGERYDYSEVKYINSQTKVKIVCPVHGSFEQIPTSHLSGKGCIDCYDDRRGDSLKSTTEQFIEKARSVHGDKYNYSKVNYANNHTKVKIICPTHGVFEQIPNDHSSGKGCTECGRNKAGEALRLTAGEFTQKAKLINGDKYDYSKVEYVKATQKVKIICPDHGEFEQTPNNHISKAQSCPKCSHRVSKAEQKIIDFICENYTGEIQTSVSPDFMQGKLELDIYLPEKRLAFEYNGNYWHDKKPEGYHRNKTKMCAEAGVELYHVWESDYNDNPEEIFELIKLELNK